MYAALELYLIFLNVSMGKSTVITRITKSWWIVLIAKEQSRCGINWIKGLQTGSEPNVTDVMASNAEEIT